MSLPVALIVIGIILAIVGFQLIGLALIFGAILLLALARLPR